MIDKTVSHYKIFEQIGQGGIGVIYKAEDLKLKRKVAIKFLSPELARDVEVKERFIREAQAASALDHRNICNIHDTDKTDSGQLFIVMAYYDGETLREKLQRSPLKLDETVDTVIQIAEGISYAHVMGIIHRDINPANIIITTEGEVKILDFGLAKFIQQKSKLTLSGKILGTISYMSPEQAQGLRIDHRTDIWSLGVVVYEMLCGQLPFQGETDEVVKYRIVNSKFKSIHNTRKDIPSEFPDLIKRALAKELKNRFQSISDMLIELRRLKKHLLI